MNKIDLSANNWNKKSLAKFLQDKYFSFNNLIPETQEFIKEQKVRGKNIYYLSNISKKTFENYKNLEIWKYFDGGIFGFETNNKKPDREAFEELEEKYSLNPQETWYIDDISENLASAEQMEWQVSYFDQETTNLHEELALAELEEYKVPKILFLGKPNVGKSTLFNSMIGKNIQIMTEIAGTTLSVNDIEVNRLVEYQKEVNFKPIQKLVLDLTGVVCLSKGLNIPLLTQVFKLKEKGIEVFYLSNQTKEGLQEILNQEFHLDTDIINTSEESISNLNYEVLDEDLQFSTEDSKPNFDHREYYDDAGDNINEEELADLDPNQDLIKLTDLFDGGVASFQADSSKPDSKIYQNLLDKYNLKAETCLYLDDNLDNIETGKQIGFKTFYYTVGKNIVDSGDVLEAEISTNFKDTEQFFNLEDLINEINKENSNLISYKKQEKYILLDSAGIRKTSQRTMGAESFATFRTIRAAFESDVICFVVDGKEGITRQDQIVAGIIKEAAKGVVVIINKSDLLTGEDRASFIKDFQDKFKFMKVKRYIWISAKEALEEKQNKDNKSRDLLFQKITLDENNRPKIRPKKIIYTEPRYLIFDFDGVIGDTWDSLVKTKAELESISLDEAARRGLEFYENLRFSGAKANPEEFRQKELFDSIYQKYAIKNGKLFNKFIKEIKKIENTKLAIVSNSKKEFILPLLGEYASKFEYILDFYDDPLKSNRIGKVCQNWGVDKMQVYYFTDTKNDVMELEREMDKSRIIGCSWGVHGFDRLKEVLPKKQILKKFKDIHKVFPPELPLPENITNLSQIWMAVDTALKQRKQRITKDEVRKIFNFLLKKKRPNKLRNKKRPVLYDLRYTKSSPPTFELLVKDKTTVHWSYMRFIENLLRQNFSFENTEIRVKAVEVKQKKVLSY